MDYDVVVEGFSLNSAEAPAKVLGRALGVSVDQARALIGVFPATVVACAERSQAEEVAALLRAAGARVAVRESSQKGPGSPAQTARRAPLASGTAATVSGPRVAHVATAARAVAAAITPSRELSVEAGAARNQPSAARAVSGHAVPSLALDDVAQGGARQLGATAYLLGDLDLGAVGPGPLPASGEAPRAKARELAGGAGQLAPATAAPAVSAPVDSSGMQGFGDGLDDADTGGPALELDANANWLANPPLAAPAPVRARPAAGAPRVAGERAAPGRASAPGIVTPAHASTRAWPSRMARLVGHLGSILVAVLGAVALLLPIAALRDSAATAQLLTGTPPPPVVPTVERVLRRADAMRGLLPAPRNPPTAEVSGLSFVPLDGNPEATLAPVLRLAPRAARALLAPMLRARIPGLVPVEVDWPEEDVERGFGADCFLVKHGSSAVVSSRIDALLRTGRWVDVPYDAQRQLAAQMKQLAGKAAAGAPFTPACLAR